MEFNQILELTVFYRLSVLHIDLCDLAVKITFDLIHQLHSFHDCKNLAFFYLVSHLNVRRKNTVRSFSVSDKYLQIRIREKKNYCFRRIENEAS